MGFFGTNKQKTVTETAVENAVKATMDVTTSRSAASNASQTFNFSGNAGTTVDGVNMEQTVSIKLRSSSEVQASTDFQSMMETELKQKLKQKSEALSLSDSEQEDITRNISQLSVDCSRVFKDSISILVNNSQTIDINKNTLSDLKNIRMAQTVEAAVESISRFVTNDRSVQALKAKIDKDLEQVNEGAAGFLTAAGNAIGGMWESMGSATSGVVTSTGGAASGVLISAIGPLIVIAIILAIGAAIYFMMNFMKK